MNKSVIKILQNFETERVLEEEKAKEKRRKLSKEIDKSTNKAYLLVWKSILEQYKIDLQTKEEKNNYTITINKISIDEMISLSKRKLIRISIKYLEELKEYCLLSSKEIVGAEVDYDTIYMIFPDKLFEELEKDNFQLVGNNKYGLDTTEIENYIDNSTKKSKQKVRTKKN